jgi:hypothetical protein
MRTAVLIAALAGCGGASLQTIQIVNKSPRPIAEVYVFPTGAGDHGASRGTVAPDATLAVKVKPGNVDVLAVSAKLRVDDKQSETRTATQTLEVKHPLSLVFYDSTQMVPGLDAPNTIGVPFQVTPEPAPEK